MSKLNRLHLTPEDKALLRGELMRRPKVFSLLSDPEFSSLLVSLGIQQEVGTINDELAPFIYDSYSDQPVLRELIRSEIVQYSIHDTGPQSIGVKIWVQGISKIEIRIPGFTQFIHPEQLGADFGVPFTEHLPVPRSLHEIVLFPVTIAKILALESAELVIVREWALNTIFGGFDPTKKFYEVNTWELVHNDTLRFAGLLKSGQIPFLGTHDLAAHIPGVNRHGVENLKALGQKINDEFQYYFGKLNQPSVTSLVLPYAAGVLTDDLAQPKNYLSLTRELVRSKIMTAISSFRIDPRKKQILLKFPPSYEKLIDLARTEDLPKVKLESDHLLAELIEELKQLSVAV